jgi:hypothetical protein
MRRFDVVPWSLFNACSDIHCVSSRQSTLAITTHPPRSCEDRARLVADKLANGKVQRAERCPAGVRHRDSDREALVAGHLSALCHWPELVGYRALRDPRSFLVGEW